jgi:hypothetical protein
MGWIIVMVVCLAVIPVAGSWLTLPRRLRDKSRRAIEARETTLISALREGGPVKVRGVVGAREPLLTSPIGGHACIGYSFVISDGRPDQDYAPDVMDGALWPSFLVTDETGTITVNGVLSILIDPTEDRIELPPTGYALLKQIDERMNDVWGPRHFVFRETLLKVGDRVSVVGRTSRASDVATSENRPAYMMSGTYNDPIVVIDDDEPVGSLAARTPALRRLPEASSAHAPSRREIDRREPTAIAALQEGEPAKIQGAVAAREPLLTSPVSGRACVGYRISIRKGQTLVVRREEWPPFLVADDTGTAAVEGPFSILLDPDDGAWANLPASVYTLLEEANVPLDKEFRFQETLLEPGDRVSVVGRPSLEIDPAGRGSFRAPPRLYVLRGSEAEPIAVIDERSS